MSTDPQNIPAGPAVEPKHVVRTFASDMAALSAEGEGSAEPTAAPKSALEASTPPEETEASRSAILSRLRARASGISEPAAPIASRMNLGAGRIGNEPLAPREATATPEPAPIPTYREPIPQAPPPPPEPIPVVEAPVPTPPVTPIHTYTTDFSNEATTERASTFSILAAQQDQPRTPPARVAQPAPKTNIRNILFISGGVLLLLLGGTGVYLALRTTAAQAPVAVAPTVSALIFVDDRVAISGAGNSLMQAIVQSEGQQLGANMVRLTYLTVPTTTPMGTVQDPVSGGALVAALNLPAPDILLRNIEPESTIGVINTDSDTKPFFILRVASYESSFRGMLSWESTMGSDLAVLYPPFALPPAPQPQAMASSTASSTLTDSTTTPISVPTEAIASASQFKDEVVANHDARALKDARGNTVLIYGYQDPNTLVIARNEDAFIEILTRLQASSKQ